MEIVNLIQALIQASHESGYYQAAMEKANLTPDEYEEYRQLNIQAINKRCEIRQKLFKAIDVIKMGYPNEER